MSNLQIAPVSGLHPLGQGIAAVKDQAGHFEREQAYRGKQHDRNKPNRAQNGSCGLAAQSRAGAIGESLRRSRHGLGVLHAPAIYRPAV